MRKISNNTLIKIFFIILITTCVLISNVYAADGDGETGTGESSGGSGTSQTETNTSGDNSGTSTENYETTETSTGNTNSSNSNSELQTTTSTTTNTNTGTTTTTTKKQTSTSSNSNTTSQVVDDSSNTSLATLGIRPHDFTGFKSTKTTYDVEVPEDTEKVEVYAKAQSSSAKVEGTGTAILRKGRNKVEVIVTAKNGETKIYTINITRGELSDGDSVSNPGEGLKSLKINDLDLKPSFDTDIYQYTVKYIGEGTTLNIVTEPTNESYKVEVVGNENLKEGENVITILVSDENDDNIATYQITVTKSLVDEEKIEKERNELIKKIVIGVVIFLVLAGIVFFVVRHRRNKIYDEDDYYDYEEDDERDEEEYLDEEEEYEEEIPKALLKEEKTEIKEPEKKIDNVNKSQTKYGVDDSTKRFDRLDIKRINIEAQKNEMKEKLRKQEDEKEKARREFLKNYDLENNNEKEENNDKYDDYEDYEDIRPKRERHKGKRFK